MHAFLIRNRQQLIERCKAKVAERPLRRATPAQLRNGIPVFLDQLIRTLEAEGDALTRESLRISGASGGAFTDVSEIGVSATAHGKQLLELGYTVDQVVHDYGDLCQAITGLAFERNVPFTMRDFQTLNRCLDNAIAEAVTEFSHGREVAASRRQFAEANERLGMLLHELRNSLQTAKLAVMALESGGLPIAGATGDVLRRSLGALTSLVKHALDEVRNVAEAPSAKEVFSLAEFIADAGTAALLDATARGCSFTNVAVDARVQVAGDRLLLLGALMNVLQNAFKFTHAHTGVSLHAYAGGDGSVYIDVEDHCGGLLPGVADSMFQPFVQGNADRSGLGLGLSIARAHVDAAGGSLSVRDLPGAGCIFTIRLAEQPPLLN